MELLMREIDDVIVRENFRRIADALNRGNPLDGFVHVDQVIDRAVAEGKIRHGLGYAPLDILETHRTGTGLFTWNYDLFDTTTLSYSTTGPCRIRAFVGTFKLSQPKRGAP